MVTHSSQCKLCANVHKIFRLAVVKADNIADTSIIDISKMAHGTTEEEVTTTWTPHVRQYA